MWEAIIQKVLTRYLSTYLDGIEREKLQVGLLTGEMELTDLTLKPDAAISLDLPFRIVFGRVGKLSVGISWSKWMSQDYDLRIVVQHAHILLTTHSSTSAKTTAALLQEMRDYKEKQIVSRESTVLETLRENDDTGQNKAKSNVLQILFPTSVMRLPFACTLPSNPPPSKCCYCFCCVFYSCDSVSRRSWCELPTDC